jgi:hypothetical protein
VSRTVNPSLSYIIPNHKASIIGAFTLKKVIITFVFVFFIFVGIFLMIIQIFLIIFLCVVLVLDINTRSFLARGSLLASMSTT